MVWVRFVCSLKVMISSTTLLKVEMVRTEIQYQRQVAIVNHFTGDIEDLGDALLLIVNNGASKNIIKCGRTLVSSENCTMAGISGTLEAAG